MDACRARRARRKADNSIPGTGNGGTRRERCVPTSRGKPVEIRRCRATVTSSPEIEAIPATAESGHPIQYRSVPFANKGRDASIRSGANRTQEERRTDSMAGPSRQEVRNAGSHEPAASWSQPSGPLARAGLLLAGLARAGGRKEMSSVTIRVERRARPCV